MKKLIIEIQLNPPDINGYDLRQRICLIDSRLLDDALKSGEEETKDTTLKVIDDPTI